jgi:thiosulfate dehydrogenase (quinone) large subunit
MMDKTGAHQVRVIEDPPFVRALLSDTRFAWLWLVLRLWLGYEWLSSASGKLGNPAWMSTGEALKGYWTRQIAAPPPGGRPAIAFEWYRNFIQFLLNAHTYTWFAKLVASGELLVGIALILGAFTGIAAFMGGFMNWNFMMSGTASTSPVMFVIAVGLIMAWKIAGYIGVDRWLLPAVGTPWQWRSPPST